MIIHLFGAATPSGQALRNLSKTEIVAYSRKESNSEMHFADLKDPADFHPVGSSGAHAVWISFAPIWLFANFLEKLATFHPERLQGLCGIVACSSSSAITKRFASNRFDRRLVANLNLAEECLINTCRQLSIPCQIVQPTLIYGKVGLYQDKNLSLLVKQLRRFPVFPLPSKPGFRQPIHASQLAKVFLHLSQAISESGFERPLSERIAVGGDKTLNYAEMILSLQQALSSGDPARRCRLLSIPNRLFFLLSAPLLLCSPKYFEAVLRMGANLSGFTPSNQLLGSDPQPFPVFPLV